MERRTGPFSVRAAARRWFSSSPHLVQNSISYRRRQHVVQIDLMFFVCKDVCKICMNRRELKEVLNSDFASIKALTFEKYTEKNPLVIDDEVWSLLNEDPLTFTACNFELLSEAHTSRPSCHSLPRRFGITTQSSSVIPESRNKKKKRQQLMEQLRGPTALRHGDALQSGSPRSDPTKLESPQCPQCHSFTKKFLVETNNIRLQITLLEYHISAYLPLLNRSWKKGSATSTPEATSWDGTTHFQQRWSRPATSFALLQRRLYSLTTKQIDAQARRAPLHENPAPQHKKII